MHDSHAEHLIEKKDQSGEILYYTCGMHPSVKVSVKNYKKGDTKCPICFMPLTPVAGGGSETDATFDENVISRVKIKQSELKLAGIKTEEVFKRSLFKEIRTVGTVAFDPELAVAQDEFLSAVKTFDKTKEGKEPEITRRAEQLVQSSKRKLLLMGLSHDQIQELEVNGQAHKNLILPDEKMWIYGEIYEYEMNLVKNGSRVKVTASSLSGQELFGEISSINPVVDQKTRTVKFRALVNNPQLMLKPQMYVDVNIMTQFTDQNGEGIVLAIPKDALLDTGRRRIVWVDQGNGQFEGRAVEVGPVTYSMTEKDRMFYPVISGLNEGEKVVTKGNFLIDSQSQISGVAASAYGGALGAEEQKGSPAGHIH